MAQGYGDDDKGTENPDDYDGSVEVAVTKVPDYEKLPEDAINLVPFYAKGDDKHSDGQVFLGKLADKVCKDFDADWESAEVYRKKRKDRYKLLTGNLDPKSWPFDECANVHVPVMLERVLRIVHRIYAEIFPDRDFVFQALPSTNLTQERADLVTLDMNWDLRKVVPDFFRQNRRALMEFITNGDVYMHSYRDISGRCNRHELLNCEEFVIPYVWKTTMPDLSDVPRKTRILRKTKNELLDLEEQGVLYNVEEILDGEGSYDKPETTIRDEANKKEGTEPPEASKTAPYTLYEQYTWCKLPGQKRERSVKVIVEPEKHCVLALMLNEHEDWKDRARHVRHMAELESFEIAKRAYADTQAQEQQFRQRLAMPDVPPGERAAIEAGLTPVATPTPPEWMQKEGDQPDPVRLVPIEPFSHGVCIENIDGSLGLGIGLLLAEHNKAANTAASQFTDSATLSNCATMIMPEGVQMEPGDTRLIPGEIHRVRNISSEQIQNAFKIIQFPPANPQLLDIVRLSLEAADGVSSAPDVLSGEPGKANETYRGIATRVEQATKQLTVLALNYLEMLSNVVRNHARLNAVFKEDDEIRHVVDPRTLEDKEIRISRHMYEEDFDIVFTADTRFTSKTERISQADQVLAMVQAVPPPVAAQIFPLSFFYEAVVRSLKARGMHSMVQYLGPRPPTPTQLSGPPAPQQQQAPPQGAVPQG